MNRRASSCHCPRVNETCPPPIKAEFDPQMDVYLLAGTVRKSRKEIVEGLGIDHETAMRQFRGKHGI